MSVQVDWTEEDGMIVGFTSKNCHVLVHRNCDIDGSQVECFIERQYAAGMILPFRQNLYVAPDSDFF